MQCAINFYSSIVYTCNELPSGESKHMYEASVSGIRAASVRMDVSAHNTANLNTKDAMAYRVRQSERRNYGGTSTTVYRTDKRPDLLDETVEQMSVKHYMKANVSALKTQDEMHGTVIDLLA